MNFFFLVLRNFKWLTEHLRIPSSGHYPSLSSCAQQDYLDIGTKNGQITSGGPWNVTFPIAVFWNYTKHQGGVALPQRARRSEKKPLFEGFAKAHCRIPSCPGPQHWPGYSSNLEGLYTTCKTKHSRIWKYCENCCWVLVHISQHNDQCFRAKFSDFSSKPLIMIVNNTLYVYEAHGAVLGSLCLLSLLIITKTL